MITITLTSAPCSTVGTVNVKTNDIKDCVAACKDQWQGVIDQAAASENSLAAAFAEVDVDGKYDDALSGELTFALDTLIRPAVVKPAVVNPVVNNTPKTPAAARKPKAASKGPNKAARVRTMVTENPSADASALMEMVAASDIDIPKSKIKDYVIGSIKTIRG